MRISTFTYYIPPVCVQYLPTSLCIGTMKRRPTSHYPSSSTAFPEMPSSSEFPRRSRRILPFSSFEITSSSKNLFGNSLPNAYAYGSGFQTFHVPQHSSDHGLLESTTHDERRQIYKRQCMSSCQSIFFYAYVVLKLTIVLDPLILFNPITFSIFVTKFLPD